MEDEQVQATAMQTALLIPENDMVRDQLRQIASFQALVQRELIKGIDYGVIPGTDKPTLLKPGAEKIAKLLGLSDRYEVISKTEDWTKPLFHYEVKCRLISLKAEMEAGKVVVVSEGLGSCNSMESKYRYRWYADDRLPAYLAGNKDSLPYEMRRLKTGKTIKFYRVDNDDIFSLVNTIEKMAKKRALVDAVLSAARLSNVFTQDLEELLHDTEVAPEEVGARPPVSKESHKDETDSFPVEEVTREKWNAVMTTAATRGISTKQIATAVKKYYNLDMVMVNGQADYAQPPAGMTLDQLTDLLERIEAYKGGQAK